jgi:hypothetical protein
VLLVETKMNKSEISTGRDELVGDAYSHGLMFGEVFAAESREETQRIILGRSDRGNLNLPRKYPLGLTTASLQVLMFQQKW